MKQRCLSNDVITINDKIQRSAMGLYIQWKEGERELDSRETERECVRGRVWR